MILGLFSQIFCLEQAQNLNQKRGKSVIDGVRVRVAFSGVWKESLSELSGGQRSLVALSLILALLDLSLRPCTYWTKLMQLWTYRTPKILA